MATGPPKTKERRNVTKTAPKQDKANVEEEKLREEIKNALREEFNGRNMKDLDDLEKDRAKKMVKDLLNARRKEAKDKKRNA